jgi:hypothetical protein
VCISGISKRIQEKKSEAEKVFEEFVADSFSV